MLKGRTWVAMAAAGLVCWCGTGRAEEVEALRGLAPTQLGGVGAPILRPEGVVIAPRQEVGDSTETSVTPVARSALAPRLDGTIDSRVLAREIASRLVPLDDCRIEVARQRRVTAASIAADVITLRWVIAESGSATEAQVVATLPADPAVLDCVKRQMLLWSFTRPTGGPLPVQRTFVFRSLKATAEPTPPAAAPAP